MPLSSAEKSALVADVAALKAHVDALVPDTVQQVDDAQQDSPVPSADWLEGAPAILDILSHFSSPSGKPLHLAATGLPSGVTVSGGSLAYDGTGSFRAAIQVPWTVTAGP